MSFPVPFCQQMAFIGASASYQTRARFEHLLVSAYHAEAVRKDLKLLQTRSAVISTREICVACNRSILDPPPNPLKLPTGGSIPPFYLFPTGQAFHVLCTAAEVIRFGGEVRADRVRRLLQKLSVLEPREAGFKALETAVLTGADAQSVGVLAAKLEEEVGCEDPWNGELLARMVDMAFVGKEADAAEITSWRL